MVQVVLKEESYKTVGACFEVYNSMGCGFLEAVNQECLEIEFTNQTNRCRGRESFVQFV